jgi:hypothetical protein
VPALEVVFFRGPSRRYRSLLLRADGVEVELDGGAYNRIGGAAGEVPHDIAHLVVEDELGLDLGVWGVLVAGGLFRGAKVVSGRQRPHAAQRAREILEGAVEQLNQAEILTRAVCDLATLDTADLSALRAATGARWWSPTATEAALVRAFGRLREAGARWAELPVGGTMRLAWNRPLTAHTQARRRQSRARVR